MRISELARRADVTIASVKYYIRIGLLPPGVALSQTRAEYDEAHLERVNLIRTLAEVGGLSIERIGEVVHALDHPPASRHELLGTAHHVLRDTGEQVISPEAAQLVEAVAVPCEPSDAGEPDAGNTPDAGQASAEPSRSPASVALGQALTAAESAGWPISADTLDTWAHAMREVARGDVVTDLAHITPSQALRHVVVGTVLTDPILIALRRVEQERLSAERLGD